MRKGKTFIITGPSGVGKGTIINKLFEGRDDLYFSVSATTRAPRPGEVDGVHYHFLSREQFQQWIAQGEFLEHAEFVDNCYGTPKKFVDQAMAEGKDVILDIEVQGTEQIHALRPEVIRIFIAPPSWEELERRLVGRATEDAEKVRKRLARSRVEFPIAKEFNYIVVNHTIEQAVGEIKAIMAAEHCRAGDCYDELFANL
jgi:guanylate kinase